MLFFRERNNDVMSTGKPEKILFLTVQVSILISLDQKLRITIN